MNDNLDNSSIDQESVTTDVLSSVTQLPKPKITKIIMRYCLLVLGGVLLALGAGIFLAPLNIVSGGLSGIAIIVDYFLPGYLDITIWILTGIFFILGFIFLGKTFAFRTLIASLVYPAVLTLVYRIDFFQQLAQPLVESGTTGDILVGGLFGGAFTGVGCALTFLGGGSTGGVDNLTFIINKFTGIKQSVLSFVIDALIIVIGMIVMWGDGTRFIACLVGILSALACAMMIEYI